MAKRAISLFILALVVFFGYTMKDELFSLMNEDGGISVLISILLAAISVFFPIIPFPLLAGTIGAIFGPVNGALISWGGVMAGTMMFFLLSHYGFREYAQHKLSNYAKINEYAIFLQKHTFLAVLAFRLVPIIPAPAVNILCGLSYVHWLPFIGATAIGKLPNILLFSYAGSKFYENKWLSLGLYGLYTLIIFLIILVFNSKRKKGFKH
ncbi:TVP38/TMEM64 family protein [Neobacillus sp. Marseille-QA0830]